MQTEGQPGAHEDKETISFSFQLWWCRQPVEEAGTCCHRIAHVCTWPWTKGQGESRGVCWLHSSWHPMLPCSRPITFWLPLSTLHITFSCGTSNLKPHRKGILGSTDSAWLSWRGTKSLESLSLLVRKRKGLKKTNIYWVYFGAGSVLNT